MVFLIVAAAAVKAAAAKYPDNALVQAFIEQTQSPTKAAVDESAPKPRNVAEAVELMTAQIGDVIATATVPGIGELAGFENHGGRTYLGPDAQPFAMVEYGFGNNGEGYFRVSSFNSRANAEEVARRFQALKW